MLNFRSMTIDDRPLATPILRKSGIENSEHCFATMLVWGQRVPIEIAYRQGGLIMRSDRADHLLYLYPRGFENTKEGVEMIIKDAESAGKPPWIYGMDRQCCDFIKSNFSDCFFVEEDRNSEDYIYLSGDLMNLPGKKYQKKRNHCSKFQREFPDYVFETINPGNIEKARQFETEWTADSNIEGGRDLLSEQKGIFILLDNFDKLDLTGAMITVHGKVVAMTIASSISDDMADVVVEKAYHDTTGAYAVINRDFVKNCLYMYKYINREDDMGEENLRKAKLSYFPYEIRKKYLAKAR